MNMSASERRAIAGELNLNEQYLYQCLTGRKDMRPEEAVRVEVASGGRLMRKGLRKNWREIWPELELVEHLRAQVAELMERLRKYEPNPPPALSGKAEAAIKFDSPTRAAAHG